MILKKKSSDIYENKYRFLIDNILDVLFELDSNGIVTYVNIHIYRELGYHPEEIIGREFFEFLFPDDIKKVTNIIQNKTDTVELISDIRIRTKDNKFIWFDIRAKIVKDYRNQKRILLTLNNINKFKDSEQKLRESEKKYRNLVEDAKEGVWALDENENTFFVNKRICEMLGYTMNEMLGKNLNLFIPDSMKELIKRNRERREKGIKDTYDLELIKKDGKIIYTSVKAAPILNENQEYKGSFAYITDITKKVIAKQKLKDSEEKYRALIQNFQGIAFQGYQDFSASFLQGAVEEITGYTEEDFISGNIKWDQLIHPDDLPDIRKKIEIFHEDPNIINDKREYRIINKYGKIKWVLELIDYFYDHKKKMDGVRGIIVDITEKKLIEQRLEESEQKYRDLIETSSMGLLEIDFVKGGVIYINSKLLDLIGYSREELNNENIFYKVIYPKDIKAFREIHEEQNIEFKLLNKEGKIIWLSGTIRNQFDVQNNLVKSRLWVQDITEKKEIAEIKSNLLTRFSHEFKTPLISIKGFTDLLLADYRKSFDNKTLSFLKGIKNGAERLKVLINNFIECSQLDKHLVELVKTRENLSNLIKLGIAELEGIIKIRDHNIKMDIPDELIIDLDKNKIYSVITNILLNSIKYTPKGGNIAIQSKIKKDSVIISIKDNGIGLKKREIKQLFKPFGKIERYGERTDIISEGIGLGLYLSKEIIDLHGGTIWVESEGSHKGCIFSFSLPFKM